MVHSFKCFRTSSRFRTRPSAATILVLGFLIMLMAGFQCSRKHGYGGGGYATVSAAAPFELLTLGEGRFDTSDIIKVRFYNNNGYSVVVTAASPNPLKVAVPLYVNPSTGQLDSGTVSVTVLDSGNATISAAGSLTIAAPPALNGIQPGSVTAAFLDGTRALLSATGSSLTQIAATRPAAASLVTAGITADLQTTDARLAAMRAAVTGFLGGKSDTIGTITVSDGRIGVVVDSASMKNSDRIIAAFVQQLPARVSPSAKSIAGYTSAAAFDLTSVTDWYKSMPADVSGEWLDWGRKVGSTIGTVTAVAGVAVALAASTPAIAAAGTTAAAIGAMGFAVSTFTPATCAIFLKTGASIILDGKAEQKDYMPEIKYVASNTIAAGASQWLGSFMESAGGELSSAVTGLIDDQAGFTAAVGRFVTEGIDLVYPPDGDTTGTDTSGTDTSGTVYSGKTSGYQEWHEECGTYGGSMSPITVTAYLAGSGTAKDPYRGTLKIGGTATFTVLQYTCSGTYTSPVSTAINGSASITGSGGTVESAVAGTFATSSWGDFTVVFTGGKVSGNRLTGHFTFNWPLPAPPMVIENTITLTRQ